MQVYLAVWMQSYDYQNGWDTDQFPDINELTPALIILKQVSKVVVSTLMQRSRNSTDPEDLSCNTLRKGCICKSIDHGRYI
jgi:xylose isomerase